MRMNVSSGTELKNRVFGSPARFDDDFIIREPFYGQAVLAEASEHVAERLETVTPPFDVEFAAVFGTARVVMEHAAADRAVEAWMREAEEIGIVTATRVLERPELINAA